MAGQRRAGTVLDSAAFERSLKRELNRLELDGERGLLRLAQRTVRAAKEFCPVDTGRLRSSLAMAPGKDGKGPFVDVGTNVHYARPVEFGTSTAPAQPFMRPALAEAISAAKRTLTGGS